MGRKLLKTVQTITTFWNPLADPVGTRRGPPLVRGPQFENRWLTYLTSPYFFPYLITFLLIEDTPVRFPGLKRRLNLALVFLCCHMF